jgi:hypothetical protein
MHYLYWENKVDRDLCLKVLLAFENTSRTNCTQLAGPNLPYPNLVYFQSSTFSQLKYKHLNAVTEEAMF